MSTQPEWKLLYSTDYSALYVDLTGVHDPELMIADTVDDVDEDDIDATHAVVYRFTLWRCCVITEENDDGTTTSFLCEQNQERAAELPHPLSSYRPWYERHLKSVADSIGSTVAELRADLCSDDPKVIASAYEAIGGHSGFDNFDSSPEEWTASEFAEWPERGVRLSTNERDAFITGYVSCALWCGVMVYKHDDDCPCHEASENGDAYDSDACTCDPEAVSSSDEHGEDKLAPGVLDQLTSDAHEFYAEHVVDLRASTLDMERAGHDFWLTRNRHGAGFWDEKSRGADADVALDRLMMASRPYGEMVLVQGANMKIDVL